MPDSLPCHDPIVDLDAIDRYLSEEAPAEEAALRWTQAGNLEVWAAIEMFRTMPIVPEARPRSVSDCETEVSWERHRGRIFGMGAVGSVATGRSGGFLSRTLRQSFSIVFDRLAGSAVAALLGRGVAKLTQAESNRLRDLVEQVEPEDE
jgi:hypothetical protein